MMATRIALVTSNGWGLGHLSRQIAVTLAVGARGEVTMFSFSRGLPVVGMFGIRGEFCASHSSEWIPAERWNAYVERRFQIFLTEVQPEVVLFDGVAPYVGILNALRDHPEISAGWLRRGMWLRGRTEEQLAKSSAFDFVVEPGDIAGEADHGPTAELDSIRVRPISLLEVMPLLERTEAAEALGLDPSRRTVLIGLAGQPGDAPTAGNAALDEALDHPDWQVAVVRSPLSQGDRESRGIAIDGVYPLVQYLRAFDAAVSAAGYNSVHELIPARVPTLLVPKSASQTDNQLARASHLADRELALMANDGDIELVRSQVRALLDSGRSHLASTLDQVASDQFTGGAHEIADLLVGSPPSIVRDTGRDEWRQPGFKGLVKRSIGPGGVSFVKRILGRSTPQPARRPVTLDPDAETDAVALVVSDDLGAVARSLDQPVEHLLTGASNTYRSHRTELIEEFYDVTD